MDEESLKGIAHRALAKFNRDIRVRTGDVVAGYLKNCDAHLMRGMHDMLINNVQQALFSMTGKFLNDLDEDKVMNMSVDEAMDAFNTSNPVDGLKDTMKFAPAYALKRLVEDHNMDDPPFKEYMAFISNMVGSVIHIFNEVGIELFNTKGLAELPEEDRMRILHEVAEEERNS